MRWRGMRCKLLPVLGCRLFRGLHSFHGFYFRMLVYEPCRWLGVCRQRDCRREYNQKRDGSFFHNDIPSIQWIRFMLHTAQVYAIFALYATRSQIRKFTFFCNCFGVPEKWPDNGIHYKPRFPISPPFLMEAISTSD